MAIAINGSSNTITGIAVGGLPDGIVDTDMLAADSVTAPKIGSKTFTSYAIIADVKASNTDSGTFTSGAWRTRDLNTELADPDGIVSISSNQFTLQSGSYLLKAKAMGFRVERHMIKLYQTSGTPADIATGTSEYCPPTYIGSNSSFLSCRFTISTATTYELQHRCQTTKTDNGFGMDFDIGVNETFALVEIFKEA